ncbi:MAG: hypothetical protein HY290_10655 [Planctomycetia bacterium]|nr:hypothetical protein [Planctomycetia bacterium]
MSAPRRILAELLSPIDCDAFFHEYWEKRTLHVVHDDSERFRGLLTRRDIDQVLAYTRPRFSDPGAFLTTPAPRSTYVRGVLAGQSAMPQFDPGLADLREAFDQGKSLVIMSMQHRWAPIATFCRGLEAIFHCPVHANMYLTPAGSQGFSAHYDPHEVFALQLEGAKTWRLYDHVEPFPMAETVRMPEHSLGAPREVCLTPGDLLYIPRGHVHDAYTSGESSLHLTVGINVYRWADLLHCALACATRNDVRLRESIPGGALPGDHAPLVARFRELLEALSTGTGVEGLFEQALHSLGSQFLGELKMLPGSQLSAPAALLTADSILERSPSMICRVVDHGEGVAIEFPGNRVTGPRSIRSALQFVAGADRFTVRELPGSLSLDAKMAVALRLLREGLVTAAPGAIGNASSARAETSSPRQILLTEEAETLNDEILEAAPRGLQQAVAAPA